MLREDLRCRSFLLRVRYPAILSEVIVHRGCKVSEWIDFVFPSIETPDMLVRHDEVSLFCDTIELTRVGEDTLRDLWVRIVTSLRAVSDSDKLLICAFLRQFEDIIRARQWLTTEQMDFLRQLAGYEDQLAG